MTSIVLAFLNTMLQLVTVQYQVTTKSAFRKVKLLIVAGMLVLSQFTAVKFL